MEHTYTYYLFYSILILFCNFVTLICTCNNKKKLFGDQNKKKLLKNDIIRKNTYKSRGGKKCYSQGICRKGSTQGKRTVTEKRLREPKTQYLTSDLKDPPTSLIKNKNTNDLLPLKITQETSFFSLISLQKGEKKSPDMDDVKTKKKIVNNSSNNVNNNGSKQNEKISNKDSKKLKKNNEMVNNSISKMKKDNVKESDKKLVSCQDYTTKNSTGSNDGIPLTHPLIETVDQLNKQLRNIKAENFKSDGSI
uniref:Uncharacterized protein n=1 Tax=Strongyloides stercoralis TaxID=6248 RepID=A0A0K0EIH9_STRER